MRALYATRVKSDHFQNEDNDSLPQISLNGNFQTTLKKIAIEVLASLKGKLGRRGKGHFIAVIEYKKW